MNPLLQSVLGMLRLRGGPGSLPASWSLTLLAFAAYIGQGVLTGQYLEATDNAGRTLVSVAIQVLAAAALLRWHGHAERLPQTLLAFALTGFVVSLVAFGFLMQADGSGEQPLLALAWLAVFGWSLAVDANIYRHALSIPLAQGMLVAVVVLGLTYVVMQLVFQGS
jgi:hypothetical protein